jgi:hypothetical protein
VRLHGRARAFFLLRKIAPDLQRLAVVLALTRRNFAIAFNLKTKGDNAMDIEQVLHAITRVQAERLVKSTRSFNDELVYNQVELPLFLEIKRVIRERFESVELSK